MHTARVTWFGPEGKLHLQLKSFPARREVKCRLDEITLPERKRHRDQLLVRRSDGALINVGRLVPEKEAVAAMEACPIVDDGHTGFFVALPRGYGIVDNQETSQLNVVPAGEIPPMSEPLPEMSKPPIISEPEEEVVEEPDAEEPPAEEEPQAEVVEEAPEEEPEPEEEPDEEPEEEQEEVEEDDDLLDLMGD